MITFDEAVRLVLELAQPLGSERVPLGEGAGRVLAAPAVSQVDAPQVDSSVMDGYAVRDDDLPGPLALIGESYPGHGFMGELERGACVRVFTGAPVPPGADRVVIQENVSRIGELVTVDSDCDPARYIRVRGSDIRAGQIVVEAGGQLTPRAMVAVAAGDLGSVVVWRRPKVVVLATGDELATPGEARATVGRIPESVSFGVVALASHWGAHVVERQHLGDDLALLERAAGRALEQADLVVVTGGASVGERDFAKAMFEPHGIDMIFSKVAMKPGKPVWLGRTKGAVVVGLPGNPTSAMVTARLLLAPLIAGLSGRGGALSWEQIPLVAPLAGCGERETFARARRTPDGAEPIEQQDSGAQAALVHADLLLRTRPRDPARMPGEVVEALPF